MPPWFICGGYSHTANPDSVSSKYVFLSRMLREDDSNRLLWGGHNSIVPFQTCSRLYQMISVCRTNCSTCLVGSV